MTSNAAHKVFFEVEQAINIPIHHIADPTGDVMQKREIKKVGLLGTKVTMTEDFYQRRLKDRYNIEVLVPEKGEQELLHKIIFDELTYGQIHDNSRKSIL